MVQTTEALLCPLCLRGAQRRARPEPRLSAVLPGCRGGRALVRLYGGAIRAETLRATSGTRACLRAACAGTSAPRRGAGEAPAADGLRVGAHVMARHIPSVEAEP